MTPGAHDSQADLRDVLRLVRRRWWLWVLLVLVGPGAVYGASATTEKEYRASATLEVQSEAVDTSLISPASASAGDPAQALAASTRRLTSLVAARSVARRLPPPRQPVTLKKKLSVETDPEAGFLIITARDGNPRRAARIANTYGEVLIEIRTRAAEQRVDRAIQETAISLRRLRTRDRDGRRELSRQLQRLRVIKASQGSNVTRVERASPPRKASSPKPVRNAILAILLGLVLAGGLTLLLERLDRRIRSSDELVRISPAPLLSSVSSLALSGARPSSADVESFHRARVALGLLSLDDPVRTLVVTSPGQGEGKTTVAVGLARAAAEAGDHVLLIDADMRLPQVKDRLEIGLRYGLDEVLTGRVSVADALEVVPGTGGRLCVLGSAAVEHPWQLVASDRMGDLVTAQGPLFDLVIIDTPPVLAVSDALPLCERASAVLMIARINRTRRNSLQRALEVVSLAQGKVVGIVATGERKPETYGQYTTGVYQGSEIRTTNVEHFGA